MTQLYSPPPPCFKLCPSFAVLAADSGLITLLENPRKALISVGGGDSSGSAAKVLFVFFFSAAEERRGGGDKGGGVGGWRETTHSLRVHYQQNNKHRSQDGLGKMKPG